MSIESIKEDRRLHWRWRRGDVAAGNALAARTTGLVHKMAKKYTSHLVDYDERVAWGWLGVSKAMDRYKRSKSAAFTTYAGQWIKAEILRAITVNNARLTTPYLQRAFWHYREVERVLGLLGRSDDAETVAKMIGGGVRPKDVDRVRSANRAMPSLDAELPTTSYGSGDAHLTLMDFVEDETARHDLATEAGIGERHRQEAVWAAWQSLRPRERTVVLMRFLREEPLTLEEVGARMDLTRERVRQIELMALSAMRRYLGVHDVTVYAEKEKPYGSKRNRPPVARPVPRP